MSKVTASKSRCFWAGSEPAMVAYHDDEWGVPVAGDAALFEKLSLEAFQSGLSWRTILTKRENFRAAFTGFDPAAVARFGKRDVTRLLGDAGIVRHRGKIEATITNARALEVLLEERASFFEYLREFAPDPATRPRRMTRAALLKLTSSPEAAALSRDLKRRGFRFVGPTTVYAFFQATGLVNDHLDTCFARARSETARRRLGLR